MHVDIPCGEVTHQGGSAVRADDFGMGSHAPILSTFCAHGKHNLSLDPGRDHPQFPDMHIGERMKRAREDKGLSQRALAAAINAVQTTISSWERGRTEPGRDDVERVAAALGLSSADLELGTTTDGATVAVVGYVQAGAEAVLFAAGQGPFDYVAAPEGSTKRTVAAEIRGTSLGPFFDSWLIFWDEARSPITPDLHGEVCIVGLPDGRILVKQVKPSKTEGLFHLMSQTESPLFDQEVLWAAKITNMRPR